MAITLPNDLERSIEEAVHNGRFASVDDAMAEAARLLLRELAEERQPRQPASVANDPGPDSFLGSMRDAADTGLGSIGFMRDAADELDEIVADVYRKRRQQTWRDIDVE